MKKRSLAGIVISNILGLFVFLLGLYLGNILAAKIGGAFAEFIYIINQNIVLLLTISILFMVAEMFNSFKFPFNISYPLFNTLAIIFLLGFFFRILSFLDSILGTKIFFPILNFSQIIYMIVAVLVLLGNYISLLSQAAKSENEETEAKKDEIEWGDVGQEFKRSLYFLFSRIGKKADSKSDKKEKKKK